MTTVISRLYADATTANAVVSDLKSAGFLEDMIDVIKPGPSVVDAMSAARIDDASAASYAAHLKDKNTLVVVRAPFMPMGAAQQAIDCVDAHASVNAGVANQNAYIREQTNYDRFKPRLYDGHILGHDLTPGYSERYGLVTEAFGLSHLKPHRTKRSAIKGGAFKSRMFWPMPLLKSKDGSNSAISGGAHMSKFFWPMPLLSKRGPSAKAW